LRDHEAIKAYRPVRAVIVPTALTKKTKLAVRHVGLRATTVECDTQHRTVDYRRNMLPGLESPERRRTSRGTPPHDPPRTPLVATIIGAYGEMPGLSLHVAQAARLFGLREETCRIVLDDLVRDGRLRRAVDGQYLLA
jgi:hypothetical protein